MTLVDGLPRTASQDFSRSNRLFFDLGLLLCVFFMTDHHGIIGVHEKRIVEKGTSNSNMVGAKGKFDLKVG